MKSRFAVLTLATLVASSACSGAASTSSAIDGPAEGSTSTVGVTTAPIATSTTSAQKEDADLNAGTLQSPLDVGAVAQVGDWSLRVASVVADATDLVMTENEFNDPPGAGEQFFIVELEATYTGNKSSTFWADVSMKTVGSSRVAYESFDAYCGSIPNPIDEAGEVFPGGTITGNACWRIAASDSASLILIVEDTFSFDDTRSFLSLDPTATPRDDSTATDGAMTPATATSIAVGEVGRVGDWSLRVSGIVANATDLVLADNEFNDPPGTGEQFFLVELEATYTGDKSSSFWADVTLKAVGPSNVAYDSFGAYCGSFPDPIDGIGEAFPGATIRGNTCWKVAAAEAGALVMIADDAMSFGERRSFFSLDPATTPIEATTAIEAVGISNITTAPLGAAVDVGDWSLRVLTTTPDATSLVMRENQFNDPPGAGEQFFMVELEATYTGDESSTFWVDMTMKTVGASSVAYESFDAYCGSIPDPIDDAGETFPGGTITGNACWTISTADADSLILIVENWFSFDETRAFLALQP